MECRLAYLQSNALDDGKADSAEFAAISNTEAGNETPISGSNAKRIEYDWPSRLKRIVSSQLLYSFSIDFVGGRQELEPYDMV